MRKLSIGEKMFLACYNLLLAQVHKVSMPISESSFLAGISGCDENGTKDLYRKCYYDMQVEVNGHTPSFSSFRIWGY